MGEGLFVKDSSMFKLVRIR